MYGGAQSAHKAIGPDTRAQQPTAARGASRAQMPELPGRNPTYPSGVPVNAY